MQLILEIPSLTVLDKIDKNNLIMISLNNYALNPALQLTTINDVIDKGFDICLNIEQILSDEMLNGCLNLIKDIDNEHIKFYSISDLGLGRALSNIGLKEKIIFRAPTYLTNTSDINLYNEYFNVITISSEITQEELLLIDKSLFNPLCVDLFGKNPILYSHRHLLSTYFDYRNEKHDLNDQYTIVEEFRENVNEIKETKDYTIILSEKYYYLDKICYELKQNDFGIIHGLGLDDESFLNIIEDYSKLLNNQDNDLKFINENNKLISHGSYERIQTLLKENK